MAFDDYYERVVLSRCLQDKGFLGKAVQVVEGHNFSSPTLSWLWELIADVYRRNRELADSEHILHMIVECYDTESEALRVCGVLEALYDLEDSSPLEALEQIRGFVRLAAMRKAADGVLEGIDDGDIDEAQTALEQGNATLRRASVIERPVNWGLSIEGRMKAYVDPPVEGTTKVFLTPFPTLNQKALPGGFPIGKTGAIQANLNQGKTSFLVELGWTAIIRSNAIVLHVTAEDERHEVEKRYDARLTGVDRTSLTVGQIGKSEQARVRQAFIDHEHFVKRLYIQFIPKQHKVSQVDNLIEMVREEHPDEPLLVLYDSPFYAVGPDAGKVEKRHDIKAIVEHVDNWGKNPALGYGPLSTYFTWQYNRKSAGKTPTSESGAESLDIDRTVDITLGLLEGEALAGSNEKSMEFWITRNRLGPLKKAVIYATADTGLCRFTEVGYDAQHTEA